MSERLRRAVWLVGFTASLVAIGWVVADAVGGIDADSLTLHDLLVAAVAFAASWVLFTIGWSTLATGSVQPRAMASWARAQLLRYIPGAIWAPIAQGASVEGHMRRRVATVGVEVVVMLAAVAMVAGPVAAIALDGWWWTLLVGPLIAAILVAVVGPRVGIDRGNALIATIWRAGAWAMFGLASAVAQAAVGPSPGTLRVFAASLIAWAAGYVVVFAPGGLGAREVTYLALLDGTAPSSRLAAGALVARVLLVIAELLVTGALALLVSRRSARVVDLPSRDEPGKAALHVDLLEMNAEQRPKGPW